MSIWDNIKKFAQPYSDEEEYDDYDDDLDGLDEEPKEKAAPSGRRPSPFGNNTSSDSSFQSNTAPNNNSGFNGQVVNMGSGKQEVVLFHAKTFDDAAKAADELRRKKAIILNMEKTLLRQCTRLQLSKKRQIRFVSAC